MDWLNQLNPTQQFVVFSAVKALVAVVLLLSIVAYTVLAERKICAAIQDRVGPNRAGPWGLLQPAADAIKALGGFEQVKEQINDAGLKRFGSGWASCPRTCARCISGWPRHWP